MVRRICVVTSGRADYGLLKHLAREIGGDSTLSLQWVATGTHLSSFYGHTIKQIREDGFAIAAEVPLDLSPSRSMTAITGEAVTEFGKVFTQLKPDLVVVLGDRFEILGVATAAMLAQIPLAHIHGGEITEGAIDDRIRHAITKMSDLHFVSTQAYRTRVIQMGESAERVFHVGAPGLDFLQEGPLLSRAELSAYLGATLGAPLGASMNTSESTLRPAILEAPVLVITYHSVTLLPDHGVGGAKELLDALSLFLSSSPTATLVFTQSNMDTGGLAINALLEAFVQAHPKQALFVKALGQHRYLSLIAAADAVVGNSSSGLIEAPALGVPTLNIGPRQAGRIFGETVIQTEALAPQIMEALKTALSPVFKLTCKKAISPYGTPGASKKIKTLLASFDLSQLKVKKFSDLPSSRLSSAEHTHE